MYYVLIAFSTAIFTLGAKFFLPTPFFLFCQSAVKHHDTILESTLDEDRKQQLLIQNLKQLLWYFSVVLLLMILLLLVAIVPVYLYAYFTSNDPGNLDYTSAYFYGSMVFGSLVLLLPSKKSGDYSYWSKLLHKLVLDNYNISNFLLEREKKVFLPKENTLKESL